ncbi:class I SAM-dependent methyltransferase [Noviherbaspirillum denitrificans]|nr:methyltransferase [Noviherbaspirillum denitrificans]
MNGILTEQRNAAYTTPRPDVFALVPSTALRVLDVGCSNGALGASLRMAREGRKVFGVEIDPSFAAEAEHHLDHVTCADLNELDWTALLPGTMFDCIIFADVLEHLLEPRNHLLKAKQRLQPGGCIVISLPNIRHISSFYSIFIRGTFPSRSRGIFDRTHLRWFTISDAIRLVTELGMHVDQSSYVIRLGDQGGGIWNRLAIKVLGPIQHFFPIREFLTYQFCLRLIAAK